jgi:hypothetical protein
MIEDLLYAWRAACDAWQFARHMRRGGNPDEVLF